MKNITLKYIAKIPNDFQSEGVEWLVIEPHMNKDIIVGYYLFGHQDLNEPSEWDIWLETLEDAFEAGKGYGVEKSDWIEKSR